MRSKIPHSVIPRLSVYYRVLLLHKGSEVVSSSELSDSTGCTSAQIRKDLAYFGQFGTPGKGYIVSDLKKKILEILGIDKNWSVALVGVGNLGTALLSYKGFKEQGFNIIAAFDNDLRKIGKRLENITIQDISGLRRTVKNKKIQMAIIAVPAGEVQEIVAALIKAKVKAILNFAPIRPQAPKSVELINIDLSIELEKLTHFLRQKV